MPYSSTFKSGGIPRSPNASAKFRILGFGILTLNFRIRKHFLHIPHDGQSALGEDVHFDETDGFDGVHVEVGGGITFGGGEARGEFVHGLMGKDQSAGVHFGIAREAIEEVSHLERGRVGFLVERQVTAFE